MAMGGRGGFSGQQDGNADVTAEDLFRALYRIRRVEEKIIDVYPTDKIQSPIHLSIGQELTSVAVCAALRPGDAVVGSYRSHAAYLAAGGDLKAFVAELYGKATGCCKGKGGSMHLAHKGPTSSGLLFLGTSAIVASLIPVATGYAWGQKLKGTGAVTVCFFGDGAAEEGCYFEALNFAALHHLPIIFVVENNEFAIHTPIVQRQAAPIYERAPAMGLRVSMPGTHGLEDLARYGSQCVDGWPGPCLLEIFAPRLKEHVGVGEDWHLGYRSQDPDWKDPVSEAMARLNPETARQIMIDVDAEIAEAVAFAEASPVPSPDELTEELYG